MLHAIGFFGERGKNQGLTVEALWGSWGLPSRLCTRTHKNIVMSLSIHVRYYYSFTETVG
jgi:hypothetical protein